MTAISPYFLDNIPAMGIGLRAAHFIPRGTLIFQERPVILIPTGGASEDRDGLIKDAVNALPIQELQRFRQLQTAFRFKDYEPDLGRFHTNAMKCEVENGSDFAGLFFLGSRFNSSCIPNVHQHWDGTSMKFYAMTNIPHLEELCICYETRDLTLSQAQRQRRIQHTRGFYCQCAACLHPALESDARRERIGRALAIRNRDDHAFVMLNFNTIFNALRDLDQERMHHYRDTLLFDGYCLCLLAGDGNNAMLWLRQAYDAVAAVVGRQDPQAHRLATLVNTLDLTQPPFNQPQWIPLGPPPALS